MNKKLIWKIVFVAALLAIIFYTFRDSAGPIFRQIADTSVWILIGICLASVGYHMIEGWITWSFAKKYTSSMGYKRAIGCAFYCSFYRLATLGGGPGVAAVYFLNKSGISYSEGTGLYLVQYLMHKIGIALFSGMLFLANWAFMISNYRNYAVYLVLAYGLTALISFGLILLAASPKSHRLIIRLVSFFNRSGKLDKVLKKLEESCEILETSAVALLKDKKLIFSSILKELLRNCFWYCIPFIIMLGTGMITLWQSFAVTSLAVMTAAVIPTPAGIGALELIMTSLFGIIAGVDMGGAITLLYRFATFIFPFFVGGVYLLITRSGKRQILNSDRIEAPALEKERS